MILPDVNVLMYAFRRDADRHHDYVSWLRGVLRGDDTIALHAPVLSGFVRIATHPRLAEHPAPAAAALDFVDDLIAARRAHWIAQGPPEWSQLRQLIAGDRAIVGALVPDAHLASVALAHGCRLATADRGFARFPGLRYFDPAA